MQERSAQSTDAVLPSPAREVPAQPTLPRLLRRGSFRSSRANKRRQVRCDRCPDDNEPTHSFRRRAGSRASPMSFPASLPKQALRDLELGTKRTPVRSACFRQLLLEDRDPVPLPELEATGSHPHQRASSCQSRRPASPHLADGRQLRVFPATAHQSSTIQPTYLAIPAPLRRRLSAVRLPSCHACEEREPDGAHPV